MIGTGYFMNKMQEVGLTEDSCDRPDLEQLASKWMEMKKRAFACAEHETDAMGKRLIEHGAIVYFNCAQELLAALRRQD